MRSALATQCNAKVALQSAAVSTLALMGINNRLGQCKIIQFNEPRVEPVSLSRHGVFESNTDYFMSFFQSTPQVVD
ncbi:MAG TPA: hypothetical protein P5114_05260 [Hyphomicrobiaceae bacterium]|nr:hypothetical protein [Hyphomicrobiaceae bacterium]